MNKSPLALSSDCAPRSPCQGLNPPEPFCLLMVAKELVVPSATPVRVSWPIDLAVQWWDNVMKACHQKAWHISIESANETDQASFTV